MLALSVRAHRAPELPPVLTVALRMVALRPALWVPELSQAVRAQAFWAPDLSQALRIQAQLHMVLSLVPWMRIP